MFKTNTSLLTSRAWGCPGRALLTRVSHSSFCPLIAALQCPPMSKLTPLQRLRIHLSLLEAQVNLSEAYLHRNDQGHITSSRPPPSSPQDLGIFSLDANFGGRIHRVLALLLRWHRAVFQKEHTIHLRFINPANNTISCGFRGAKSGPSATHSLQKHDTFCVGRLFRGLLARLKSPQPSATGSVFLLAGLSTVSGRPPYRV